jgi:hypothetical protein
MPEIVVSGPLFDGRAQAELFSYVEAVKLKLAQEAVDRVQRRLTEVIRKQVTGRAVSEVMIHPEMNDLVVTNDTVIYAWWLEGVGSRNFPVTRFKGYHTFRLVGDQLERDAEGIAEQVLIGDGYLRRMGGI